MSVLPLVWNSARASLELRHPIFVLPAASEAAGVGIPAFPALLKSQVITLQLVGTQTLTVITLFFRPGDFLLLLLCTCLEVLVSSLSVLIYFLIFFFHVENKPYCDMKSLILCVC